MLKLKLPLLAVLFFLALMFQNCGPRATGGSAADSSSGSLESAADMASGTTTSLTDTLNNGQPNHCPSGSLPIPDHPEQCGRVLNVYSGFQYGSNICGENIANLDRCYSWVDSYPSCYYSPQGHGSCIEGYNCPQDQYPAHMTDHCGGKTYQVTDPRCITDHSGSSTTCL